MRALFRVVAFVCLSCAMAFATSTVTGNFVDGTGTALTSRVFGQFDLRGCNGNIPRVTATGIIAPISVKVTPNGSGAFSTTLYKTSEIDCGGSTSVTTWDYSVWYDGRKLYTYNFTIDAASFNVNSATPNSVTPTVTAPTGDSIYLRLDGGNTMTGNILPAATGQDIGSATAYWDVFGQTFRFSPVAAPTCVAGYGFLWYDSSASVLKRCENGGAATVFGGNHALLDGSVANDTVANTPVLGDVIYANATPKWTKLAGNTTSTKKYLTQTGTGAVSAVPAWSTIATADLSANVYTRTACYIAGGDNASAVLADADDQNDFWVNDTGGTMRVTRVWGQADGGTPIINLQRDDGTAANILTSNLTLATGNGVCADSSAGSMSIRGGSITCSNSISATERDLSVGHALNFSMVTAGGTAKRVTVCVQLTPQ